MKHGYATLAAQAALVLVSGSSGLLGGGVASADPVQPLPGAKADQFMIVDCLLPGQVRKVGNRTFLTARKPIKASVGECEVRGGEYVAFDRANLQTALKIWQAEAEAGDKVAQNYLGEIYERGLGVPPDYVQAANWYRKAAEQGLARAQTNLGFLYEQGRGVEKDLTSAVDWYRKAAGLRDKVDLEKSASVIPTSKPASSAPESKPDAPVVRPPGEVGPEIKMIEPPVVQTRGLPEIKLRSGLAVLSIVGKVSSTVGLLSLNINDHIEQADRRGFFRTGIPVLGKSTTVKVVAVDKDGRRSEVEFVLVPESQIAPAPGSPPASPRELSELGRFHALVIGNDAYRAYPALSTAVGDAKAVAEILENKYGFQTTLMLNADRYQLLSKLNELREKLGERDNLLVYYAGHGELDERNLRGYWLPTDAEPNSPANWISNIAITDMLNAMQARHVIVISDSCYSGAIALSPFAEPDQTDRKTMTTLAAGRSRTVFSSGGLRPVLDGGGSGHSVFARAFLEVLVQNGEVMAGYKLYQEVAGRVAYAAQKQRMEQIPEYAPIRFAGHEAGDFLFVVKKK